MIGDGARRQTVASGEFPKSAASSETAVKPGKLFAESHLPLRRPVLLLLAPRKASTKAGEAGRIGGQYLGRPQSRKKRQHETRLKPMRSDAVYSLVPAHFAQRETY